MDYTHSTTHQDFTQTKLFQARETCRRLVAAVNGTPECYTVLPKSWRTIAQLTHMANRAKDALEYIERTKDVTGGRNYLLGWSWAAVARGYMIGPECTCTGLGDACPAAAARQTRTKNIRLSDK
jgi:hypothetical protein